jgi:titin
MKLKTFVQAASAAFLLLGVVAGTANAAAPQRPVITAVTADALSFTVTFKLGAYSAPVSNIAYSTDNGASFKDTEYACGTSCTVSVTETSDGNELAYGNQYDLKIRVTNPDGNATSTSWPFQFVSSPTPPSITGATATSSSIVVTFLPGANGGAALTGIDYSTNGGSNWRSTNCSICDTTTSATITISSTGAALSAGNTYAVTLRTKNRVGTSAAAEAVSVTLGTAPSAPSITTITSGVDSLAVTATLGSNNGSPITSVEYSTDGGSTWKSTGQNTGTFTITELSASKTPLTAGTSYSVRVRSINNAGASAASNAKTAAPLSAYSAPAAPTINGLTPGLDSLVVSSTLGAANGSAVTEVEYSTDGGSTWKGTGQNTGSFTITEISASRTPLQGGTAYSVRVRSINNAGASAASNAKTATPLDTPLPPVLESLTGGASSLTVKAVGGLLMGGTLQRVEYSTDGGSTWQSTAGTSFSFTITSPSSDKTKTLTAGTRYRVAVRSVTNAGTSPSSNVLEAAAGRVPATPSIKEASRSGEVILVTVLLGSDNGSSVTRLEYSTDNGATWAEGRVNGSTTTTPSPAGTTGGTTGGATGGTTGDGGGTTTTTPTANTPALNGSVTLRITTESNGDNMISSDAAYKVTVRAINSVGASASSAAKTVAADNAKKTVTVNAPSNMVKGTSATVTTASPSNATVTLKSDTTGTCTVSGGRITAVATGSCRISATDTAGNTGSASITVTDTAVAPTALVAGRSVSIKDYVTLAGESIPTGAKIASTAKTPKICTVAKGKVRVLKSGNCRIWVKVTVGGVSTLKKLSVSAKAA